MGLISVLVGGQLMLFCTLSIFITLRAVTLTGGERRPCPSKRQYHLDESRYHSLVAVGTHTRTALMIRFIFVPRPINRCGE